MYETKQRRTALVIPVHEAMPFIQAFRSKHIPTPAAAMPPHVTLRGPFVPCEAIDGRLHDALVRSFASRTQFQFTLQTTGRFEQTGVLYLRPEPERAFQASRCGVEKQFPDAPPDFSPSRKMHVTVARCHSEEMDKVERAFCRERGGSLPIRAVAREVCLYEKRDGAWHKRGSFGLAEIMSTPEVTIERDRLGNKRGAQVAPR